MSPVIYSCRLHISMCKSMYACVCMCACVCVCVLACMYVCICVYMCVRTRVCMSCMCACMDMHFEVVDTTRMYIATLIASLVTKYVSLLTKFWL